MQQRETSTHFTAILGLSKFQIKTDKLMLERFVRNIYHLEVCESSKGSFYCMTRSLPDINIQTRLRFQGLGVFNFRVLSSTIIKHVQLGASRI